MTLPSRHVFRELDALRGIAALMVVFWHILDVHTYSFNSPLVFTDPAYLANTIFYKFFRSAANGRSCVILFFVLSGFVLGCSLQKRQLPYIHFCVKRILRIYPAFFFVIITTYVLHLLIGARQGADTAWLSHIIHTDMSLPVLMCHLTLTGTISTIRLDEVIWSLAHELRISLLFPLIWLSVRLYGLYSVAAYMAFSFTCWLRVHASTHAYTIGFSENTVTESLYASGYFTVFFAVGAYLALHRQNITLYITSLPRNNICVLWAGIFYLFETSLPDYAYGIAAFTLITLTLSSEQITRFLSHRLFLWLGDISYSLYLVHIPVLYVISQTYLIKEGFIVISATVLSLSLLWAHYSARMIEIPFQRLGKRLSMINL